MTRQARSISVKLYLMVALAAAGIGALLITSFVGSARMEQAGRAVYAAGVDGLATVSAIELRFERLRAVVLRATTDDDTENLATYRAVAAETLTFIRDGLARYEKGATAARKATLRGLDETLNEVQAVSSEIFEYAEVYRQAEAEELFHGRFTELEKQSIEQIVVIVAQERDRAKAELVNLDTAKSTMNMIILIVSLAALAAAGGTGLFIARSVASRTSKLTVAMTALAGNDTTIDVPGVSSQDEIGEMARAVEVFKDNAIEAARLKREQAEQARVAEDEKRRNTLKMADDLELNLKGVADTVSTAAGEMKGTAQSMSAAAEETTTQATVVASVSEEASANVAAVAAAAEELSQSIDEVGRQVGQATKVAEAATDQAQQTNTTVNSLADGAQKIGEVVSLINDIAEQTNLLALNATIEAARAGDAGKGFAVVASEVKSLASQTAKATDEIGQQIGAMQSVTQDTVTAIQAVVTAMEEINQVTASISTAMERQTAATTEIARNVQEAATGTQEVSANITGVSEAATNSSAAASQVVGVVDRLTGQSQALHDALDTFLARLRAA
ncbi:MAG: methyl-accepting chemotaxis protein [Minwuiales bacterium]|nr:methyl-accepting chemotaxis protein [Minwuiales bacterium]